MKTAIMQPYLFPYIGYFQLINAVDKFVIYDDVNFIKQGWINRNNILVQGKPFMFTVPLKKASSFSKINEIFVDENKFGKWKSKFFQTLEQSYKKAPFFVPVFEVLHQVFSLQETECSISKLNANSLMKVCEYLNLERKIVLTSALYNNNYLSGKERVMDICKIEKTTHYINPIGGQELYEKELFQTNGLKLSFIKSLNIEYQQHKGGFVPWLSMIDVMMFNSPSEISNLLNKYELI